MTHHRTLAAFAALALACGLPNYTTSVASEGATTVTSSTDTASTTGPATTSTTSGPTTTGTASTTGTGCDALDCTTTEPQCLVEGGELRCVPVCDVWTQDCPEGQKCMPWANDGGTAWNATKCVDVVPNAGKPGDACTVQGGPGSGMDTCEKASMCWNIDKDAGEGTCVAFCMGTQEAPICPAGTHCEIAGDGVWIPCLPNCDPLVQDCGDGNSCIPQTLGDGFLCVLDASGETGTQNDPCDYANACDPGLFCAEPALASECDPNAASGCCLPFCDLTMPTCTNQGAVCLPWYEVGVAPPGLENVGFCGLMR